MYSSSDVNLGGQLEAAFDLRREPLMDERGCTERSQ